jgi:hypothetical protein
LNIWRTCYLAEYEGLLLKIIVIILNVLINNSRFLFLFTEERYELELKKLEKETTFFQTSFSNLKSSSDKFDSIKASMNKLLEDDEQFCESEKSDESWSDEEICEMVVSVLEGFVENKKNYSEEVNLAMEKFETQSLRIGDIKKESLELAR